MCIRDSVKVQSRSANPRFPTLNLTRGKTPLLLLPLPSVCLPVKRQSIRVLARTALIVPCISRGHGPHLAQLPADVSTFQLAFSFFDFGVRKFETATRRPLPVPYTTPSGKVKIIESINIKIKTVVTFPERNAAPGNTRLTHTPWTNVSADFYDKGKSKRRAMCPRKAVGTPSYEHPRQDAPTFFGGKTTWN